MKLELETTTQFWEKELQATKPYLFNLAWQVIETFPARQWNVLICDDNSARLPTQFIQKVLELAGHKLTIRFIAAGKMNRSATTKSQYTQYVKEILVKIEHSRILIISEAAGSFKTIDFLLQLFKPYGLVDFALIASHTAPPKKFNAYVGGYGIELAAHHVYQTFEAPRIEAGYEKNKNEPIQGNALTNLIKEAVPGEPWGHDCDNPDYSLLVSYCSRRMDELADEYWKLEGKNHKHQ